MRKAGREEIVKFVHPADEFRLTAVARVPDGMAIDIEFEERVVRVPANGNHTFRAEHLQEREKKVPEYFAFSPRVTAI
jgi:hypothetical protein